MNQLALFFLFFLISFTLMGQEMGPNPSPEESRTQPISDAQTPNSVVSYLPEISGQFVWTVFPSRPGLSMDGEIQVLLPLALGSDSLLLGLGTHARPDPWANRGDRAILGLSDVSSNLKTGVPIHNWPDPLIPNFPGEIRALGELRTPQLEIHASLSTPYASDENSLEKGGDLEQWAFSADLYTGIRYAFLEKHDLSFDLYLPISYADETSSAVALDWRFDEVLESWPIGLGLGAVFRLPQGGLATSNTNADTSFGYGLGFDATGTLRLFHSPMEVKEDAFDSSSQHSGSKLYFRLHYPRDEVFSLPLYHLGASFREVFDLDDQQLHLNVMSEGHNLNLFGVKVDFYESLTPFFSLRTALQWLPSFFDGSFFLGYQLLLLGQNVPTSEAGGLDTFSYFIKRMVDYGTSDNRIRFGALLPLMQNFELMIRGELAVEPFGALAFHKLLFQVNLN